MMSGISSRLPEIVLTLKILKNVVALAPLGEHVVAGIELAISICEMAEVREMIILVVIQVQMADVYRDSRRR
jgi:hypothetical protein